MSARPEGSKKKEKGYEQGTAVSLILGDRKMDHRKVQVQRVHQGGPKCTSKTLSFKIQDDPHLTNRSTPPLRPSPVSMFCADWWVRFSLVHLTKIDLFYINAPKKRERCAREED